jgi:enoyl-CoA hydratase/carnithine racemase
MTDDLILDRAGAVATLTLNRPQTHNAINLGMYEAIPGLIESVAKDPEIKVLVLRGAGEKAFASGADISEFREVRGDADSARAYNERVAAAEQAIEGLEKPTIAMIHGYCIGGGLGLALACDLRFADDRVRMAITPSKLGLVYSLESTKRVVDLVGPSRAKWILMSGQQMRGARVLELGLADELTTPEELEAMTYEFAELVCSRAQFSVRSAKTIVGRVLAGQVTDDEFTTELRNSSFDTDDYAEGVRAFLGKRAPLFTWS